MNNNAYHVGGVSELSIEEIDVVGGGLLPVAVFVAGAVFGFALAAAADYLDGGLND